MSDGAGRIILYGATGYTGGLIASAAARRGMALLAAGRRAEVVRAVGARFGFETVAFGLDDRASIERALDGAAVVLNAAGPFSATAEPLARACLRAGVSYVDVTGEVRVLERLAGLDAEAKGAGATLLPGAGFDVAPSDCLAAYLARRIGRVSRLRLTLDGLARVSRGTAKTALEAIGRGAAMRKAGRLVEVEGAVRGRADFGDGPVATVAVGWGDVATAFRSTGAPDIETHFVDRLPLRAVAGLPRPARRLLGSGPAQAALRALVDATMRGPGEAETGRCRILGEAWDAGGRRVAALTTTGGPYALTAETALETAVRVADGSVIPGFQTPATAFGPDFALAFEGVSRRDIDGA